MDQQFYARGKILLSSEFMILHGSKALALPIRPGQILELHNKEKSALFRWTAHYDSEVWFQAIINLDNLQLISSSEDKKAEHLIFMLKKLIEIKPEFIKELFAADVITRLEFDPNFGFGSSSTLTSLLAQWARVDPMQFHFSISKGSGYDVACAQANSAILYELIDDMPVVQSVDFHPNFAENLYFVYLGKKQETSRSVAEFLSNYIPRKEDVDYFTGISCEFLKVDNLHDFGDLIIKHEQKLAQLLKMRTLKELHFPDLNGYVKSLGAWGGDFALLASDWEKKKLISYFHVKGINKWFSYNDLVI